MTNDIQTEQEVVLTPEEKILKRKLYNRERSVLYYNYNPEYRQRKVDQMRRYRVKQKSIKLLTTILEKRLSETNN